MKSYLVFFTILAIVISTISVSGAQGIDTATFPKQYKNTVRLNLSSPLIFGSRYLVVGYERMVGKDQSFSVNIGSFGLPNFVGSDSVKASRQESNKGFHISVDYRFYIASENKFRAPHGLYIGPYVSYNTLRRNNTWTFNNRAFTGTTNASLDIDILTVGGELGYQFVFWKRLAVDFVALGPGIGNYNFKAHLATDIDPQQRNELLTTIVQKLKDNIPGAGKILNSDKFVENSGISTWTIGYRYILHVGYRF